jgi:cell division protein FtsW (lipid II flippase)
MKTPDSLFVSRALSVVSVILGLLAVSIAGLGFWSLSNAGFPDGHVTEYEKATHLLRTILLWMNLALGLYLFRLAIPYPPTRTRAARIVYVISALLLVLACVEIVMPWYFVSHLGLDNGGGA